MNNSATLTFTNEWFNSRPVTFVMLHIYCYQLATMNNDLWNTEKALQKAKEREFK
jgi:hypothetical protein